MLLLLHLCHWHSNQALPSYGGRQGKAAPVGDEGLGRKLAQLLIRVPMSLPQTQYIPNVFHYLLLALGLLSVSRPSFTPLGFQPVKPRGDKERNLGEFYSCSFSFICGQGHHVFFF